MRAGTALCRNAQAPWEVGCALAQTAGRGAGFLTLGKIFYFRITARLLTFAHREPWALIPKFYCNFNRLNVVAATDQEARPVLRGVENFRNRVQLTEMRDLWAKVRTFFIANWDEWQEIDVTAMAADCAEKSIGKIADTESEANSTRD